MNRRLSPFSGHWLDRVLALVVLGLSIGVLTTVSDYPDAAASLPSILGWLLLMCSVGLWLFPGKQAELSGIHGGGLVVALVVFCLSLWLFEHAGGDVALLVLFLGCAWIMGYPIGLRLIFIGLFFMAVIGVLFGNLLGVPLPGPVFSLFIE
ncbi:MAG: hypothetical protein HLX50_16175 [Alteromonadaceae bacterium]|nr:hypothetical protein [Alteromonadaceae bacterium]